MANPRDKRVARKINYGDPKKRIADKDKGWTPTAYRVPDGMSRFRFTKEKTYRLTIVPFVAGDGNPYAEKGTTWYERTYYVHPDIGPEEETLCCSYKTFDKPCPECHQAGVMKRANTLDEETQQAMRPKERQLWLVIDHDERDKGVQLLECAHYGKGLGFGEMLDAKLDAASVDSPYLRFYHLGMDGMTLVVKTKQDSYNGRTFFKPSNMELEPRRPSEAVPDSILDEVPCLDDLPIEVPYEEFEEKFLGTAPAKTEKPATKPNGKPAAGSKDEPAPEETTEEATDEEEATLEVGATVEFMFKGKAVTGEVTEIREDTEKAVVRVEGHPKALLVGFSDLAIVAPAETADGEDQTGSEDAAGGDEPDGDAGGDAEQEGATEEGEGDESADSGAEEDEGGDSGGEGEGDETFSLTDEDEDLPFDEDDEAPIVDEEEPEPAPAKKPAAKPAAKAPAKPVPTAKPAAKPQAAPAKKPGGKK